jgi:glutaredoxin 3
LQGLSPSLYDRNTRHRSGEIMVPVTIYTRQFCGYCTRAKSLLEEKGVEYVEHDATFSPDLRQEMIGKSNGRTTFPQIFIGADHVGGCDDLFALDRAGKLDPMLAA